MEEFAKKWGLLLWPAAITILMVLSRILIDYLQFDVIPINALLGALVTGVVFTIAMILTGTLSDYKESEKIPSDLVSALKALWYDSYLISNDLEDERSEFRSKILHLWNIMSCQLRNGKWDLTTVNAKIVDVNAEIAKLNNVKVPINVIIKLRAEVGAIDKIVHRIAQIKDTDFIPAAYAIAETAISFMLLIMAFVKSDTIFDTIGIAVLTMLVVSLLQLIKDIDDPFDAPGEGFADVDMFQVYDASKYMKLL